MPAYLIADIKVSDVAEFERYRPLAAASIEKAGGRYVVRGGAVELLEEGPMPERIVMLEFPTMAQARAWYYGPEYQDALKIRLAAATGRVFFVDGVA